MKLVRPMIIAGLLLSALPAFAQTTVTAELPKDGGKACAGKCGFDSALKLTPEQKEKLGSLRDSFKLSTADKKAQLDVAHDQMRRLLEQPTIDKQAALSLQNKINGLKDELSTARLNMMLASADIFTPDQRAAFARMRGMHHSRHQWGGHRGPGGEFHGRGDGKQGKVG
ncbi:MAG: Spy/CpxP family protein refolding chaperone [Cyanobacteria bacterium SZAS LIN-2]|nr:Spy/CpxP family protein refolding chaperone [Cyanobacteria bacterium SZAS LIN-2]